MTESKDNFGKPESPEPKNPLRTAQFIIAGACVVAAIGHAFFPGRIDQTTAALLGLAAIVLCFDQLTKFKGFGIEFEKKVLNRLEKVQANVDNIIGKTVGPGNQVPTATKRELAAQSLEEGAMVDPNDPNKNQFGGSEAANDRILQAVVTPLHGPDSPFCRINAKVRSTNPQNNPLTGSVTFHLHPTFGRGSVFSVDVKDGVASTSFAAYGAFTIGVVADDGKTRLELDLVNVDGGTPQFRAN